MPKPFCPFCGNNITQDDDAFVCWNKSCTAYATGYPVKRYELFVEIFNKLNDTLFDVFSIMKITKKGDLTVYVSFKIMNAIHKSLERIIDND